MQGAATAESYTAKRKDEAECCNRFNPSKKTQPECNRCQS